MSHGGRSGGGGGMSEHTNVGMTSALVPFLAFYGLFLMPRRWPAAFRALVIATCIGGPFMAVLGTDVMSGGGVVFLLVVSAYINKHYMTHLHYRPSPSKQAQKERQIAELTRHDHLRRTTTWNNTLRERK